MMPTFIKKLVFRFIYLGVMLSSISSIAQNQIDSPEAFNFTLSGIIKDSQTGESLPFASVLIKGTILKYGLTENVFTKENLENAFGGVLRHFSLGGRDLHEDGDKREVSILTDDERPFVQYGNVPLKKDKK